MASVYQVHISNKKPAASSTAIEYAIISLLLNCCKLSRAIRFPAAR